MIKRLRCTHEKFTTSAKSSISNGKREKCIESLNSKEKFD